MKYLLMVLLLSTGIAVSAQADLANSCSNIRPPTGYSWSTYAGSITIDPNYANWINFGSGLPTGCYCPDTTNNCGTCGNAAGHIGFGPARAALNAKCNDFCTGATWNTAKPTNVSGGNRITFYCKR